MTEPYKSNVQATTTITLALFLKLLGFFVVMFSYADFQPSKMEKAQHSLQERFHVALPLAALKTGQINQTSELVQNAGRAFAAIEQDLASMMDFLASEPGVSKEKMYLTVVADTVLSMEGEKPRSSDFAKKLSAVIQENTPKGFVFSIEVVAQGENAELLMRGTGDFIQEMVAAGYSRQLLTAGYEEKASNPMVQIIITARAK